MIMNADDPDKNYERITNWDRLVKQLEKKN